MANISKWRQNQAGYALNMAQGFSQGPYSKSEKIVYVRGLRLGRRCSHSFVYYISSGL